MLKFPINLLQPFVLEGSLMSKLVQLSFCCFFLGMVVGCGPSTPKPPSQEELDRNAAAMEADLKTMMQQVPAKPK